MHEIIKYEIKPVVAQLLFDFLSRLTKFHVDNEDISDPAYGQGAPIIIDIKDDDISEVWVFFSVIGGKVHPTSFGIKPFLENDEDYESEFVCCPHSEYKLDYEKDEYWIWIEHGRGSIENIYRRDANMVVSELINRHIKENGIFVANCNNN